MKNLKLDSVQRYYDEKTGRPLQLCFDAHELVVDGIIVKIYGVPLLKGDETQSIYYPDKTKYLISYFVSEAKKQRKPAVILKPKDNIIRYPFAENYNFNYSHIDYEYIPGLARPSDNGFLTPVFFNLAVLNKYSQHPEYKLELFSETYGSIWKGGDWHIAFGINKNKKVIMWLGDINELPDEEKYYLRSENIESDHDIHSEFYDAQIECKFSEPSMQTSAFHSRQHLNELCNQKYGFDLYVLNGEVSQILENADIPVFWQEKHLSQFIESLNKVFIESLNAKEIKKHLKQLKSDIDIENKKGLKLLQMWLDEYLYVKNPDEIMLPFFVLYDFRIMLAHLLDENKKENIHKSISKRLKLKHGNDNYQKIYEKLIEAILSSYKSIIDIMSQ